MKEKVRTGVFFLAGDYFWQAGVIDDQNGRFAGFAQKIEADVERIIFFLSQHCEVVTSRLLHSTEQAVKEARLFKTEGVDAIIYIPIIWTYDQPIVAFLQEMSPVPILIWAYSPFSGLPQYLKAEEFLGATGAVSVQQSSNILQRYHWDYEVTLGNETEPNTVEDIHAFLKSVAVKRSLIGSRIAVIPSPCRVVVSTWVDEFFLNQKFGIELLYISVEQLNQVIQNVTVERANDYLGYLKSRFPLSNISDETLLASCRQAVGMADLVDEYGLSGIALEDFNEDIYRVLKFRPHLYHPHIGEMGAYIGLEADVSNVLSTLIISRLSGGTGMFNELLSVDTRNGTFLMGHPGPFDFSLGDPDTFRVTRDLEFDSSADCGAWVGFRAHEGTMTFLNFTPEYGRLKTACFQGDALPGSIALEGYVHMIIKPRLPAVPLFKKIVKLGLIQHWGTAYGDLVKELEFFSNIMSLNVQFLTPQEDELA